MHNTHFLMAMRQQEVDAFVETLAQKFAKDFPKRYAKIGAENLHKALVQIEARANGYGYLFEDELHAYASVAYYLGSHFDQDPLYPWIAEILAQEESLGLRMHQINTEIFAKIPPVLGDDFGLLIEAYLRFLEVPKAQIERLQNFEQIASLLATIYPQKMRMLGESKLAALLSSQESKLKALGLFTPLGTYVYAIAVFFWGADVDKDPLHAWLDDTLHTPELTEQEKTESAYGQLIDTVLAEKQYLEEIRKEYHESI